MRIKEDNLGEGIEDEMKAKSQINWSQDIAWIY